MGREREMRETTGNSADDSNLKYTGTKMLKYDEQSSITSGTRTVPT